MKSTSIGTRIVEVRKFNKQTQAAFANAIGVSRSVLSQIEIGKITPTLEVITSVVKAYNTDYRWLVEGESFLPGVNPAEFHSSVYSYLDKVVSEYGPGPVDRLLRTLGTLPDDISTGPLLSELAELAKEPNAVERLRSLKNPTGRYSESSPSDASPSASPSASPTPETQNKPYLFLPPDAPSDQALDAYLTGAAQRPPLVITVDSDERERITLVREEAYAGYLAGFADIEHIGTLPTFNIPSLTGRTFRAFQVRGDSMLTTLFPGDIVVCSYVDNWRYIRDGDVYVVVSQYDGIIVKRITSKLAQEGPHLICRSDNTSYKPLRVKAVDISEVWRFEARISFQLANYSDSDYEGRLTTLEMLMADLIEERESAPAKRRLGTN